MSQAFEKSRPVPAAGFGPNAGGEFSQENYHHPAAGWGAANSVTRVLFKQGELIDGARVVLKMNHENGDLLIVMGVNASSNAPRMLTSLAKAFRRGAQVIHVNPLIEAASTRTIVPHEMLKWRCSVRPASEQ